MSPNPNPREIEDQILEAHMRMTLMNDPEDRWPKGSLSNIGWAIDEVEGYVTSKIYGPEGGYLTTHFENPTQHFFTSFTDLEDPA